VTTNPTLIAKEGKPFEVAQMSSAERRQRKYELMAKSLGISVEQVVEMEKKRGDNA
jgi:transaldolase